MSPTPSRPLWLLAALLLLVSGCIDMGEHQEDAQEAIGQMGDRGRFCLSLARGITAIESGAPDTASEALEEAVTQAPDDLLEDVRALADAVRAAQGQGVEGLRDPELRAAADTLFERTRSLCEPG